MADTYQQEHKVWYNSFLKNYFFNYFARDKQQDDRAPLSVELYITPYCNLACKYCYVERFKDHTYPKEARGVLKALKNVDILINHFIEKKYYVTEFDLFGGESLSADHYISAFKSLERYSIAMNHKFTIMFPANVLFVEDESTVEAFVNWQKRFNEMGISLFFSFSLEGKYCDPLSRPAKDPKFKYDDVFYDKVRMFAKKLNPRPGFHPMIAAENISMWKENFDWYLEYIKDIYGVDDYGAIKGLYLLEVRNENWNEENLLDLAKFIHYAIKRIWDICNNDKEIFFEYIIKHGMNIFSQPFIHVGRGYGCSLQTTLYVRMGDLAIIPCHRTSWEGYESGKFIVENEKIVDIEPINGRMHHALMSAKSSNQLPCSHCPINALCYGGCAGANLEITKSMFVQIPSVCRLEHVKYASIFKAMDAIGIYEYVINRFAGTNGIFSTAKIEQIKYIKEKGK